MNGITILIWITIALIAIISIIIVKLHYKGDQLEHEEGSIIPGSSAINEALSIGKNKDNESKTSFSGNTPRSLSPQNTQQRQNKSLFRNQDSTSDKNDAYIVPEVSNNNLDSYEYQSQNQVLINYDNTVEKFQEPIKQSQMDIMTQNNNDKDTTELKDLFTIDELIKESKRKDNEREKESQKIRTEVEDKELTDIKESIKNKKEEPLIEEVLMENEEPVAEEAKEETIGDLIKDSGSDIADAISDEPEESEISSSTSQKEIDEVISTASQEIDEKIETISEEENITDVLLNETETEEDTSEIAEPALRTPHKVDKTKDYKLGASIDDDNPFENNEEDGMDLDYRKDLDRFANKIKGSRIYQDVKEKLIPETPEEEIPQENETYIRNVNEYDEYEPIINETHIGYEELDEPDYDERLRQENTRRMFNMTKKSQEPEVAAPKVPSIKDKPSRDNIKIQINNNDLVLKKGDEIIFNHLGETYSSQVYAIKGDDIHVRYRRKDIVIKPSDVKKIY